MKGELVFIGHIKTARITAVLICLVKIFFILYSFVFQSKQIDNLQNIIIEAILEYLILCRIFPITVFFMGLVYCKTIRKDGWRELPDFIYLLNQYNRYLPCLFISIACSMMLSFIAIVVFFVTSYIYASLPIVFAMDIVKYLILYDMLPSILWNIMGFCIGFSDNKKLILYISISLIYVFNSGFILLLQKWTSISDVFYRVANFMCLYVQSNKVPNYYYLVPVSMCNWYKILFWIIVVCAVLSIILKAKKYKTVLLGLSAALFLLLYTVTYKEPVYAERASTYDAWQEDTSFYSKNNPYHEVKMVSEDNIEVDKYRIEINLMDCPIFKTSIYFAENKPHVDECCFTLYHGYTIMAVKDLEGNDLKYTREYDFLNVINDSRILDGIVIEYKGGSQRFYAFPGQAYLPAFFPYYPVPGYQTIYDLQTHSYNLIKGFDTDYELCVISYNRVESSLPCVEYADNTFLFRGKCCGVTMICSDMVNTYEYLYGKKVIYSGIEFTQSEVEELVLDLDENHDYGTIIVPPYIEVNAKNACYTDGYHSIMFRLNNSLFRKYAYSKDS